MEEQVNKETSKAKIHLDEAIDMEDEETYENFLQDFYQEMNIEADKSLEFLKENKNENQDD
jgi:hypothetical protein